MTTTTMRAATARSGFFYVWMAAVCALIGFGGFSATYWFQMPAGTFVGPPILHLHGVVFSAWLILLVAQTMLAAQGRLHLHKAWGVVGVSLATAMVFLGLIIALRAMNGMIAGGYAAQARPFMLLPLGSLTLFTVFFVAAMANVRRPEWHKRLVLVATCGALTAATARFGFLIATHGGGPGMRPGLGPPPAPELGGADAVIMSLVLLAGVVRDWRAQGRPHPAYLIGIAAILAVGFLGPILARTAGWASAMDALATLTL